MIQFDIAYIYFYGVILVGALIHLYFNRKPRHAKRVLEIFLLWVLIAGGVMGFYGFIGHIFYSDLVAYFIGWPPNSPFQFEVGIANLTLGVLGTFCIWLRGNFWVATVIANAIMGFGGATGHVLQMVFHANYAPGNTGLILYIDIFAPILGIVLLLAYLNAKKFPEGV